jgi:hypothetical protein
VGTGLFLGRTTAVTLSVPATHLVRAIGYGPDLNDEGASVDPDLLDWYAQCMVHEQAGHAGQTTPGAGT